MPPARLLCRCLPLLAVMLWLGSGLARAQVCVTDDADRHVCLDQPATRVIALSPGATELVFAAGAGEQLVGAVVSVTIRRRQKNCRGWVATIGWTWRRYWP